MGGVRFLSIEFKTFEFILEGGGVHSIRINELGRGFVHSVVLGRGCAIRVAGAIEDLISKPYIESFARTFRVGDTVIFLQRCSNRKGRFISIQEIHRGGRKGTIIIPEGRNGVGWRGFGVELRRHCVPEVKHGVLSPVPTNQQKIEAEKVLYAEAASSTALPAGDAKGKQAVINLGDSTEIVQDFQPKMEKISLNMATCNSDSTGTETGRLQFCLNIQIVRGLDGAWGVKQANICGHKQGPEFPCGPNPRIDLKPNRSRPHMRFHKPKTKFVWRPKAVSKAKSIQNQFGPKPIAPFRSSLEGSVLNPLSSAPAKVSTPTNGPKPALTADMEATGECGSKFDDVVIVVSRFERGTSRPAHYHVLLDEIGFSPDDLQNLIHSLAYVNQRSTNASSLVAPIFYAHLAAHQMGQFLKFEDFSASSSGQESIPVPQLPRLHEDVAGSMFFC
ncbi:unnamed protein product [Fraxinus pennsylvanica]|uniref:Piwi domain-containing protein n=1 Tax=Fraxinus pennsylvanica TaxID=56036 RepID=A0AAD2A8N7_9LAMI|nr:unnamed protein product [Fraxinus pennsylvanica]